MPRFKSPSPSSHPKKKALLFLSFVSLLSPYLVVGRLFARVLCASFFSTFVFLSVPLPFFHEQDLDLSRISFSFRFSSLSVPFQASVPASGKPTTNFLPVR